MTFLVTSLIEVFVPALQALASTFSRRVRRGLLAEFPSRRSCQVTRANRMARITTERHKRKTGMLEQVTPAQSRTSGPNPARTYPVRAPRTRHSGHQGNITDPAISLYNHSYTYLIHPSIAYAIAASQRFASCHEAVVVSFDMNGD